ncbi:hypothetical protein [Comamonas badia]|uniref:hypothetical protein n=1 Tax=Comamonas badia TaxID=265291 RepID=UPI0004638D72|nr:hypothetical protein [Comamonas badia]
MKHSVWIRWIMVWMAALLLAACGGGDDAPGPAAAGGASSRIVMLAAPSGQLLPGDSPTHWTLLLDQPSPQTFWYEDRPLRGSGEQALTDYIESTWTQAYGAIDPHATLHFQQAGSADLQALYASLGRPVYDAKARQLRVPVTVFANSAPTDGQPLSLRKLFLQVLNNASGGQGSAFYLQHADSVSISPDGPSGQYQLVLSGVADTTLLATSAPGPYHEGRPTADFSATWNDSYGGNPPNAALYGSTGTGQMWLYFFTLGAPRYDAAAGTVSYTATSLGDGPAQPLQLQQVALNIDSVALSSAFSVQCKDYNGNPVQVRPKTISIHNNSDKPIYPVLTIGAKPVDQWLQGCMRTNDPYTDLNDYKLFVNEASGLPPHASVTLTLPLYSKLAAKLDGGHITWWNGGRVILADDKQGLNQTGETKLPTPEGVSCQGQGTDCQMTVYSLRGGPPPNIYAQLTEYTFGDSVIMPGQADRLLKPENVGYNISYVDQVYVPVAIGPRNNPYIGYSGSTMELGAFRSALNSYLNTPIGQGWPVYNMEQLQTNQVRIPSGYNIFADRDGTLSPDAKVPVIPPPIPPATKGFPPVLTVLKCIQGQCTDDEKKSLHFGESVQRMQNLWGSCVDWGGEDLSKYVTGRTDCPPDLRQNLTVVKQFFAQNHADYLALVRSGKCKGTQPERPTFDYWQAITHIYGWVPFNEGCGAGANPLADTKIPGWDHAKVQFMYIHDLQYNYLQPAVAANPDLLFNPYVKLVHKDLGMSAYGFSVDDAVGFMSELGDGLVFSVGGSSGLENPEQFNYGDGFSLIIGPPTGYETQLNKPVIKRYGVCSLNRQAGDPQCQNPRQDVTMPTNSQILGFRVGTVKSGAQDGYPLVVRFTDLDDNVYTFRVNQKFAVCPSDKDTAMCPTNRDQIVDKAACTVTDASGKPHPKSSQWCGGANPNQQREAKEAQVVKNYISFPVPVNYLP